MSDEIHFMDLDEFLREGFLQEANRRFFHPLGLALYVECDKNGVIRIGGLWDYRDDPEGMIFDSDSLDQEKARAIDELWAKNAAWRKEHLGYVVQPLKDNDGS